MAAPQPPVEFTGRIVCGPPVRSDDEETLDVGDEGMVVTRYRGGAWRQSVTMSDQRLEGTIHQTYESDTYSTARAGTGPLVFAATWRIENEDGAWESRSIGATHSDGTSMGGDDSAEALIGEGAYEGLVAVMEVPPLETLTCDVAVDVRGIIFDSGPVPEPYIPASSR